MTKKSDLPYIKRILLLICLSCTGLCLAIECPAQKQIKSSISPEKSNRSYKPRYATIAHKILDIEADTQNVNDEMYKLVDMLIDEAKTKVKSTGVSKNSPETVLRMIDNLLARHNFLYPKSKKDCWTLMLSDGLTPQKLDPVFLDNELLTQGSNRRRIGLIDRNRPFYLVDCDTASFLYLGIGEALGLPLSLVDLPEHNFIRWNMNAASYLNWETIYGTTVSDEVYKMAYLGGDPVLAEDLVARRVFLVSMSTDDVLGYEYAVRALKWEKTKNYMRAIEDYNTSIRYYPRAPFAYNNLAWLYSTIEAYRDGNKGVDLALKATAIYPKNANYLDTLAAAYAETGNFTLAVETEKKAYDLDPLETYKALIGAYSQSESYIQYRIKNPTPTVPQGRCIVLQEEKP